MVIRNVLNTVASKHLNEEGGRTSVLYLGRKMLSTTEKSCMRTSLSGFELRFPTAYPIPSWMAPLMADAVGWWNISGRRTLVTNATLKFVFKCKLWQDLWVNNNNNSNLSIYAFIHPGLLWNIAIWQSRNANGSCVTAQSRLDKEQLIKQVRIKLHDRRLKEWKIWAV